MENQMGKKVPLHLHSNHFHSSYGLPGLPFEDLLQDVSDARFEEVMKEATSLFQCRSHTK